MCMCVWYRPRWYHIYKIVCAWVQVKTEKPGPEAEATGNQVTPLGGCRDHLSVYSWPLSYLSCPNLWLFARMLGSKLRSSWVFTYWVLLPPTLVLQSFHFLRRIYFDFMCEWLSLCIYMYHVSTWCLRRAEEGVGSPRMTLRTVASCRAYAGSQIRGPL